MKNRSISFAFIAVGYVAMNSKDSLVSAARIAKEYKISRDHLHKVFQDLVRAKILKSRTGPGGGFALAHRPSEITMLQIVEAIDGPLIKNMPIAKLGRNTKFARKMQGIAKKAAEKQKMIYKNATLSQMLK